ncbi:MAG: hypothetical protein ABI921_12860, partial [Panacibacter sp.]
MNQKPGRRSFIKNIGIGSVSAAILPAGIAVAAEKKSLLQENEQAEKESTRVYNGAYTGSNLNRIAFPLGGLGAGMICMEGTGCVSHVSVRNKPEIFN